MRAQQQQLNGKSDTRLSQHLNTSPHHHTIIIIIIIIITITIAIIIIIIIIDNALYGLSLYSVKSHL